GSEGYAEIDFSQRKLTLVQSTESVRQHGLDPNRLDPASRLCIRDELFRRHLELKVLEGKTQDQLTSELQHFVSCVRTGQTPCISAKEGYLALLAAEQILDAIARHRWDGCATGLQMPPPSGLLFPHKVDQEVA